MCNISIRFCQLHRQFVRSTDNGLQCKSRFRKTCQFHRQFLYQCCLVITASPTIALSVERASPGRTPSELISAAQRRHKDRKLTIPLSVEKASAERTPSELILAAQGASSIRSSPKGSHHWKIRLFHRIVCLCVCVCVCVCVCLSHFHVVDFEAYFAPTS